jgi:DNA-binding response OmpR family regulator
VFLVDDKQSLLELGKEFLESIYGLKIDLANSALEGLAKFKEVGHDVIISDFQMPEMDGIEFLRNLRAMGDCVPYILFTGRGREEVAISALNNGADFYLKKEGKVSVQYTELASIIEKSAKRHKLENQLKEKTDLLAHAEKMGRLGCWEYDFMSNKFWCSNEVLEMIHRPDTFLDSSDSELEEMIMKEDRQR